MRIFIAGASGALGGRLVPMLVERGHEVTGMTRFEAKAKQLRDAGAEAVVVPDLFDRAALDAAVAEARPEVVVHQLTALSNLGENMRNVDRAFTETNRLRGEGTDALLAAAKAAGARRFVAQSFAGWPYAREGGAIKTEEDRLDPSPPSDGRKTLGAIRHLEEAVTGAEGIEGVVLRYGGFYGPGTGLSADGPQTAAVRKRRFPVIGSGQGMWSLVHIDDAAEATRAAIEGGAPGIYNIVDDEPAPSAELLPELARAAGAKPPRHIPVWIARLMVGPQLVTMMTQARGASNAKAKRELGWAPAHPTWRTGFREVLG